MEDVSIQGYGITDRGLIRSTNEDYYAVQDNLFLVADGMGGHNAGEIASKLTIETILMNMKDFFESNSIDNESEEEYKNLIISTIKKANNKIIQTAIKEPSYQGMGTTLILALFQKPNLIHIANVGDSRAYLFRENKLNMISEDHSLANIMIDGFNLKNEDVKSNFYQKYLTRAVGINSKIKPYYILIPMIPGDKILLCSDGLWNMIGEKEIMTILKKNITDKLKCKKLIRKANELGGLDNITAIIISVTEKIHHDKTGEKTFVFKSRKYLERNY
jgi:protein phosphatase